MKELTDRLRWATIYWVVGAPSKYDSYQNEVRDPPNAGYGLAYVIEGERRSTIFCPTTFLAYNVSNDCAELDRARKADPAKDDEPNWSGTLSREYRPDVMEELLRRRWRELQTMGLERDYDVAAIVFRELGLEVPAQIMKGGEEDKRRKGGKDVGSALLKPVNPDGKRGRFLAWFLEGDGCSRSVREAMAEFSMTRSNALSYLYMLRKDHGIGYDLVGDMATVTLPDGCTDPFAQVEIEEVEQDDDDDDDSWLD